MTKDARRSGRLHVSDPVVQRLRHAGFASPELLSRVQALGPQLQVAQVKTMLQHQDAPVRRPRFLISGWGCRFRYLPDGRRQIFGFILPGEGVGVCLRSTPLANASTMALTSVQLIDASPLLQPGALEACSDLVPALQAQADLDERRALNQIVRLGRQTALERLAHLFLELHERLEVVGLAENNSFQLPITQETLADMTGLSIVHVNRTLQELKRQDLVSIERGLTQLLNRNALVQIASFEPETSNRSM